MIVEKKVRIEKYFCFQNCGTGTKSQRKRIHCDMDWKKSCFHKKELGLLIKVCFFF